MLSQLHWRNSLPLIAVLSFSSATTLSVFSSPLVPQRKKHFKKTHQNPHQSQDIGTRVSLLSRPFGRQLLVIAFEIISFHLGTERCPLRPFEMNNEANRSLIFSMVIKPGVMGYYILWPSISLLRPSSPWQKWCPRTIHASTKWLMAHETIWKRNWNKGNLWRKDTASTTQGCVSLSSSRVKAIFSLSLFFFFAFNIKLTLIK